MKVSYRGSFDVLSTSVLLLSNPSVTEAGLLQYHFFIAFCLHNVDHKLRLIPLWWNADRRALLNYVERCCGWGPKVSQIITRSEIRQIYSH